MFEFRQYMDLYERETMSFIFGRTCMYGKEWENIPIRHFMHGVFDGEGCVVIGPVAVSKTNLLRSLKLLQTKGLIEVRKSLTGATNYRIKKAAEIDHDHVIAVMRREQPRVFTAIQNRLQPPISTPRPRTRRAPIDREQLDRVVQETVIRNQEARERRVLRGPNLDLGWSNFGPGSGPSLDQHNIPKENIPISNIAAQPQIRRQLKLTKRNTK